MTRKNRDEDSEPFGLADTIEALRAELAQAEAAGEGKTIKFGVDRIALDFEVAITRQGSGTAGIKFWVVTAEAGGKIATAHTQNIHVELTPKTASGGNLDVHGTMSGLPAPPSPQPPQPSPTEADTKPDIVPDSD